MTLSPLGGWIPNASQPDDVAHFLNDYTKQQHLRILLRGPRTMGQQLAWLFHITL